MVTTQQETTREETVPQTEEQVDVISLEQLRAVLGGIAAQTTALRATCGDYNVRV